MIVYNQFSITNFRGINKYAFINFYEFSELKKIYLNISIKTFLKIFLRHHSNHI
jgi:hypothetical protein